MRFKKDGPFYEMVSAFMSSIAGSMALNPMNPLNLSDFDTMTLEGKVHPEISVPLLQIIRNIKDGHFSTAFITNSLCCMLANTAYETVKDQNDQSPEFEFFRHIRNAASHKNKFNFFAKEPALPASWRGKVIDESIKGSYHPLHNDQCFGKFFASADILVLLWDIDRKLQ